MAGYLLFGVLVCYFYLSFLYTFIYQFLPKSCHSKHLHQFIHFSYNYLQFLIRVLKIFQMIEKDKTRY